MTWNSDRPNPEVADDLVVIGEILKPHGIRGEVKVYAYSEQPENFKHYNKVVLQEPAGSRTEIYRVVKCRAQGKLAILQLEGVSSREAAEAILGSTVWLKRAELPKLDPGEYYWHQLQGLSVLTESGQALGEVSRLFSTSAHDIMVVTGAGHEYMIPVNGDIIRNIDEQRGKIIISPPVGLLEINE
jgi:16S rRNA processing protein RimM